VLVSFCRRQRLTDEEVQDFGAELAKALNTTGK
jgi:hypothetical protein